MITGRWLPPILAATCALIMSSCGNSEQTSQTPTTVFESISARNAAASRTAAVYNNPPEAMPQVRYIINGKDPSSVADSYVVGEFVAVNPGRSFRWTRDDENEFTHETQFNAEEAQISTVHLVLRVKRSIVDPDLPDSAKREFDTGKTVTLGLSLGAPADIDAVRDQFQGHTLAALLYKSPVFEYDRNLWGILRDGALLGTVSEDGQNVTFPTGDQPEQQPTFTVEELERPAGEPIRVTYEDGRYVREGSSPPPTDPSPDPPQGRPGPRDVRASTAPTLEP